MAKVTVDNLAETVQGILEEYAGDVKQNINAITHKLALSGVSALRSSSPGKRYPQGWRTWSVTTRTGQQETIYNAKLPGLAHLLEHGHAKRNGGRTRSIVHIKPVEEELIKAFMQEVEDAV